ncbi:MAG TPA: hypothetical protein VF092_15790 [Longimicrobium sp.]
MPKAEKKCWSESFGMYGSTIRVAEREPGGVLYLLWIDNKGKRQKRSLGHRDRKLGKKQALELATRMGEITQGEQREPEPEPLTLREGIALAFDPVRGMYPTESKHSRESRKLAERGAEILGHELQWAELTPGKIQYLVRVLGRRSKDGRGARTAEYMCDMLYGVASWLRQEELIPETAALPKRNWKVRLKQEWQALTGVRVEPKRPRHSVDEVALIFAALPAADPRLRLLVELAAELRAGQAVRAKRSDLVLDAVGGFGLGRFIVHGRGKKHGEVVDLHPELRALVDEVLSEGYLSVAEAALRRKEIEDYYLFPAGRLKEGKALLDWVTRQPLGPTAIRDMFRALEKAAGVEHQAGRSFYGLRRQATDLAPEFAQDARVLNRLTGHLDSATRERVYQDPQNEIVRARAAKARREMRQYLGKGQAA